ncbi:MAG: nucleotide sugar dehydrogenase [Chloroflexi bacterium HGW-Chloroflexi-8]|nr:MAG: nucleotide sugar dehydrogenase [Chloroflexi bacterium HGW-Chloroflexi-8]
MINFDDLKQKILKHEIVIGVIGLGYVGLPVACMFAKSDFQVIGLDIKQDRIDKINLGESPIEGKEPGLSELLQEVVSSGHFKATTDYNLLSQADIILIDVETPVDENNRPQYVALRGACSSLAKVMKDGVLVIVESTIAPGTIDRVVQPLLEECSNKKSNIDFYLGACPERVMPGKLLTNLHKMSRVCGGSTQEVSDVMVTLYQNIVEADLDTADPVTAELTKTAENAYRDVQIAFANELAMICESTGADFIRVRELVNKSPGRNVLLAGAGVGGHCIPKDPWLLAFGAQDKTPLRLIPAARAVNDGMPIHIGELLKSALGEKGLSLTGSQIIILGYSYLENSGDIRNSPSEKLVSWLRMQNANVLIHDPWVEEYKGDLLKMAIGCDAAVLMVAHQDYFELSLKELGKSLRHHILVDGRNVFDQEEAIASGFSFKSLGRGE